MNPILDAATCRYIFESLAEMISPAVLPITADQLFEFITSEDRRESEIAYEESTTRSGNETCLDGESEDDVKVIMSQGTTSTMLSSGSRDGPPATRSTTSASSTSTQSTTSRSGPGAGSRRASNRRVRAPKAGSRADPRLTRLTFGPGSEPTPIGSEVSGTGHRTAPSVPSGATSSANSYGHLPAPLTAQSILELYEPQETSYNGNSFFEAIALQTGRTASQHGEVRAELVETVRASYLRWVAELVRPDA